jgi:hypothetical protein
MMTDAPDVIEYQHGGASWHVPADLLALQKDFFAVNDECSRLAAAVAEGDDAASDAYHQASGRRMDLALAKYRHPWLLAAQDAGQRHQADMALRALAKSGEHQ